MIEYFQIRGLKIALLKLIFIFFEKNVNLKSNISEKNHRLFEESLLYLFLEKKSQKSAFVSFHFKAMQLMIIRSRLILSLLFRTNQYKNNAI